MLQQSKADTDISKDSLDFDPYESSPQQNTHLEEQEYSESESSSSDDEEYKGPIQKKNKSGSVQQAAEDAGEGTRGKTKIYHENTFTKLDTKINLHKINTEIGSCEQKELTKEKKNKDKADRATVEQVLD
jgi:hypothetical protein